MLDIIARRLKELGYEASADDDKLVEFCSEKVRNCILDFTNLTEIPEGLFGVFVDRVCGEVLFSKLCSGGLGENALGVKSISEGDVSVSFSGEFGAREMIDELRGCGGGELVCYRKIRW